MPLNHSGSKKAIGENIKTEMAAGKPNRQAIAIALDVARRAEKAMGGAVGYAEGGEVSDAKMARAISDRAMRGLEPTPEQQEYLRHMQEFRDQRGEENLSTLKSLKPSPIDMPNAKVARSISDRAMRGRDDFTYQQQQQLADTLPGKEERSILPGTLGAIGAEFTRVPQALRAAEAIKGLYDDPSIATAADAGVNTLAALGNFKGAAGVGLGGLGLAGAKDAGLFDMGANAQQGKQTTTLPKLPPEMNAEYARLVAKAAQNNYISRDDRNNTLARIKELQALSNDLVGKEVGAKQGVETDAARKKIEEDGRAVKTAEAARDAELSRRRRFSDTEVGKVWDKLGGWGPAVVGGVTGASSRLATGPGKTALGHFGTDYALPGSIGALTGAFSSNIPLAYNAFMTEPDNPEKRAYEAYARELPPSHERKKEWTDYAAGLPEQNPVRKQAAEELYDWEKAKERMIFGAGEGLGGGLFGAELVRAPGRAYNAMFKKGDATPKGPTGSPPTPPPLPGNRLNASDLDTQDLSRLIQQSERPMIEARANPEKLTDRIQAQNRTLGPVETPSLPVASAAPSVEPKTFNGMPLPPGWDLNSRGIPYNVHTGQTIAKKHYTARGEGKKSGSKTKAKDESVQATDVPIKPDKLPDDPSLLTRGMNRGGAIGRALQVVARAMGGRVHTGAITEKADGGRTDTVPMHVAANSYVVPADIVSSLGQGDTNAGYRVLEHMFGPAETRAEGGAVPIIAAGGEFVLTPEQVAQIGAGNAKTGHEALDQWVKIQRRKHIQTLKGLPGPARD